MKKLDNHVKIIAVLLALSVIVLGVAIYFLYRGIEYSEALFIIMGILLIVVSFYSTIVCGQRYAYTRQMRNIAERLEKTQHATVEELSKENKKTPAQIDKYIMSLIKGEFIEGYYYDHKKIEKIEERNAREMENIRQQAVISEVAKKEIEAKQQELLNSKEENERIHNERCKNCGASVVFKGRDGLCPYCGNVVIASEDKK